MSEEQLIRRAQQGDNSAFEQLLLAHQKKVYNLCLRMAANPDDALDLSQEAFIKAWRALGQYQFEASFSTWLFRLTSNVCIDFLRRKKRRQETSLTENYDDRDEGAELSIPDVNPLPQRACRRLDLLEPRGAADIQQPVDLGQAPSEPPGQFCLADALIHHRLVHPKPGALQR